MASKTTLSWMKHSQGNKCHARRCENLAVEHRLCDEHLAYWHTHGHSPPMPNYDQPEVGADREAKECVKGAQAIAQQLVGEPMVRYEDALKMREAMQALNQQADKMRLASIEKTSVLRASLAKVTNAYNEAEAAYRQVALLAEQRIKDFENRSGMEILGEREAPMYSGIPAAGEVAAPVAAPAKVRRIR